MPVRLTDEQNRAARRILDWYSNKRSGCTSECALAGYAGTGKTTLMTHIAASLHNASIGFLAPTGKAASVLASKLRNAGVLNSLSDVSTIHSYMYICEGENKKTGKLKFSQKEKIIDHDLLIVDEASMISSEIHADLRSLHKPILYVGDSGQLPPVESDQFEPLMRTDIVLKTVHRQAMDNPIIRYATAVREGRDFNSGTYDGKLIRAKYNYKWLYNVGYTYPGTKDIAFLCATNRMRVQVNSDIRGVKAYRSALPLPGETLICLKNYKDFGIFNGMQLTVDTVRAYENATDFYDVSFKEIPLLFTAYTGALNRQNIKPTRLSAEMRDVMVAYSNSNELPSGMALSPDGLPFTFAYGYALTVHKSQGSEWENVVLFSEKAHAGMTDADYRRWLYTGMTRARNKLVVFDL